LHKPLFGTKSLE